MKFKDHFSAGSQNYHEFRPHYPEGLYAYLASLCHQHELAWDCATGSGQAATGLTEHYQQVVATDASAAQIASATLTKGIRYAVATADNSPLTGKSADLITVAQALHWFDLAAFASEAKRVLKPDAILAAWTYNLLSINAPLDQCIVHLYENILGEYWPTERKLVANAYAGLELPFSYLDSPTFEMTARWNFSGLLGYLSTWSAVREYEKAHGINPIESVYPEMVSAWGDMQIHRVVTWPITVKIWRNG